MERDVDVIIPTLKPGKEFLLLIEKLEEQSMPVNRIIVMNTEKKYFEQSGRLKEKLENYGNVEVHHISREEFDHGNTRNKGVEKSRTPYFICMTQDAIPADEFLVERLMNPLIERKAAISYARQLPREDCNAVERFTKGFNYPEDSRLKGMEDMPELGIKTFFCSNACAAYDREIFEESGGFIKHTIFNEDMIYAFRVISTGKKIAYTADARVIHSHNYTWRQDFHRNFDLGVSQADNPGVFGKVKSESEGIKLVKQTALYLKEQGESRQIFNLIGKSAFKFLGYRAGLHYRMLPKKLVIRCSMNRNYWRVF